MRLFVGLEIDTRTRDALSNVSGALQASISARYIPPVLFHITLAYLGERGEDRLPALQTLLSEVAGTSAAFPLMLSCFGWFGEANNAILYAGLEPSNALLALNATLREYLTRVGEAFDPKPLLPHITLARKAVFVDGITHTILSPAMFQCNALTLFHSTRLDNNLQYLPIFKAPFPREYKEVIP